MCKLNYFTTRCLAALLLMTCALCSRMASADAGDPEKSAVELITPAATRAVERGLKFLAARQDEDGSFGSGGYSRNCLASPGDRSIHPGFTLRAASKSKFTNSKFEIRQPIARYRSGSGS